MKTTVTISFDTDSLDGYTDAYIAQLWHVAQANPAPIEDVAAGNLAEAIGREIIRRWLKRTPPQLHTHQGRHHYCSALHSLGAIWQDGAWVLPKASAEGAEQ